MFHCMIVCAHHNYHIHFLVYAPRMRLTPLGGDRRPPYKHSSYSTIGFSPLRVCCRDFPLSEPWQRSSTDGHPRLEVDVNPTPQSRFPLLEGITCMYRRWDFTYSRIAPSFFPIILEHFHDKTPRGLVSISESKKNLRADIQSQTKIMTK